MLPKPMELFHSSEPYYLKVVWHSSNLRKKTQNCFDMVLFGTLNGWNTPGKQQVRRRTRGSSSQVEGFLVHRTRVSRPLVLLGPTVRRRGFQNSCLVNR